MIRTAAVALREKLRKYKGTLPGIHKLWTIITIIYLWTFYSTKTNPYLFKQLLVVFSVTCSLLPWLPPGDLPNPGIEPRSPALQVESLLSEPPASKNTGVDSLSIFQGISPTKELNPGLLHCRLILYQLSYQRNPTCSLLHSKLFIKHPPLKTNYLDICYLKFSESTSKRQAGFWPCWHDCSCWISSCYHSLAVHLNEIHISSAYKFPELLSQSSLWPRRIEICIAYCSCLNIWLSLVIPTSLKKFFIPLNTNKWINISSFLALRKHLQ